MSWLLWYAKGDQNYPWRIQDQDNLSKVIWARRIEMDCFTSTDIHPDITKSHPPAFTVRVYGKPESDSEYQEIVLFKGAKV